MSTPRKRSTADAERDLREQALRDADALFRVHGQRAIAVVSGRLIDQTRSTAERRCDRLTLLAVERLDREQRQGTRSAAMVVWKPSRFSLAGIAGLFGIKVGPGRSRRGGRCRR